MTKRNKLPFSNYQTRSICHWLTQDEGFANLAKKCESYEAFLKEIENFPEGKLKHMTPDNIRWNDSAICIQEVDNLLKQIVI